MSQDIFNSEAKFEEAVIALLQEHGWSKDVIKNPTEADLLKNRAERNNEPLGGVKYIE